MRFWGWFRRSLQTREEAGAEARRWSVFGGRRMLIESPYVLPKDEAEGGRLDLQHHLLKVAFGRNYAARLRAPRMILDVACGTGVWGRELAKEFPQARVMGFDFDRKPLEASLKTLGPGGQFPGNFQFLEADALKRFPFEDGTFDFTFARLIAPFVPIDQWPHVVGEMRRVTRPGGYVEVGDSGGLPVSASPSFTTLATTFDRLMKGRNLHADPARYLAGYLREAGLIRIKERTVQIGVRREEVRQRQMLAADMLSAAQAMAPIFVRLGLFTQEECATLLAHAREEVPRMGITWSFTWVYGVVP
ncbi:MAG TPA: methyltransferase domain-containing protein [Ktedonobacterales bacterium]|jgi:ubiquinone/menaquinone biosynthesis C-methylase UbiE